MQRPWTCQYGQHPPTAHALLASPDAGKWRLAAYGHAQRSAGPVVRLENLSVICGAAAGGRGRRRKSTASGTTDSEGAAAAAAAPPLARRDRKKHATASDPATTDTADGADSGTIHWRVVTPGISSAICTAKLVGPEFASPASLTQSADATLDDGDEDDPEASAAADAATHFPDLGECEDPISASSFAALEHRAALSSIDLPTGVITSPNVRPEREASAAAAAAGEPEPEPPGNSAGGGRGEAAEGGRGRGRPRLSRERGGSSSLTPGGAEAAGAPATAAAAGAMAGKAQTVWAQPQSALGEPMGPYDVLTGLAASSWTVRFTDSSALRLRRRAMVVWENPGGTPQRALIVKKIDNPEASKKLLEMVEWLEKRGVQVFVEREVHETEFPHLAPFDRTQARIDFAVTLGGDGTVLHLASLFEEEPLPPVVCFAMGTLGFLTPFDANDFRECLSRVLAANSEPLYCTLRTRKACEVYDANGRKAGEHHVLNDVVVDRGSSPTSILLEIYVDGGLVTVAEGDGLVIATPSGSTAYSMSAGGPMVAPSVPCTLITPMAPHSLSFRPLIIPEGSLLTVRVSPFARSHARAAFDGKHPCRVHRGGAVRFRTSLCPLPVINKASMDSDWYEGITQKLKWNQAIRGIPKTKAEWEQKFHEEQRAMERERDAALHARRERARGGGPPRAPEAAAGAAARASASGVGGDGGGNGAGHADGAGANGAVGGVAAQGARARRGGDGGSGGSSCSSSSNGGKRRTRTRAAAS